MEEPSSSYADSGYGCSQDSKYKSKKKQLQKAVKEYIILNAALCDQVSDTQERLVFAKEKRRFLTERLFQIRAQLEQDNQLQTNKPTQQLVVSPQQLFTSSYEEENARKVPVNHPPLGAEEEPIKIPKKKPAKVKKAQSTAGPSKVKKMLEMTPQRTQQSLLTNSVSQPYARSDPSATTNHTFRFVSSAAGKSGTQTVPVDAQGKPIFPLKIGEMTLHSLGNYDCHGVYEEAASAPVGFCSSRVYVSMTDMYSKCVYTCRVVDGGDRPWFEIDYEDYENVKIPLSGTSANDCVTKLMQYVNKAIGFQIVPIRNLGEKFFGLSHPGVKDLIRLVLMSKKQPESKHGLTISIGPDEKVDETLNFDALQNKIAYYNFDFENMDVAEEVLDSLN